MKGRVRSVLRDGSRWRESKSPFIFNFDSSKRRRPQAKPTVPQQTMSFKCYSLLSLRYCC